MDDLEDLVEAAGLALGATVIGGVGLGIYAVYRVADY
jgi:hypothetical protein